jgi:S-adenosylmethionine/arginine decarboxylase-like enzyme
MKLLFHQHLLVKAYVETPPRSEETLNQWLRDVVAAVRMNVCIEPRSFYVDIPGNEGLTGQIGLSTSHLSIHIWDEVQPAMVQCDLYSCSCFETKEVLDMLRPWGLLGYEAMTIDRNENFKVVEHLMG